jgi:hypothetical protein
MPIIPATREAEAGRITSLRLAHAKLSRPCLKRTKYKQITKEWLRVHEALTPELKKKKRTQVFNLSRVIKPNHA